MAALSRLLGAVRRKLDRSPKRGGFPIAVEQFRGRLPDWDRVPCAAATESRVAVLVTPWVDTAVPMFAIETALAMRARGATPVFLLDLAQLGLNDVSAGSLAALESLAVELERFGEVVAVSGEPADPS